MEEQNVVLLLLFLNFEEIEFSIYHLWFDFADLQNIQVS